jgi:cell division protein FtsB
MSSRFSYTSNFTKLIIVIEFALVSYLLYSLTKNIYNGYQVDQVIETFQRENAVIEEDNRRKNEDYLYFTSEEYIDKIAKQNLGLVDRGEEVIILSQAVSNPQQDEGDKDSTVNSLSRRSKMTNPEQWWDFFFGR